MGKGEDNLSASPDVDMSNETLAEHLKVRLAPLPILIGAVLLAGSGAANAQLHLDIPNAYLWDQPNFRGHHVTIVGGSDDLADLRFAGRAISGHFEDEWTICDAPSLAGNCATVHGQVPDVTRAGLSGPIMSLRLSRPRH